MKGRISSFAAALGVPLLHRVVKQSKQVPAEFLDGYSSWAWERYHRGFLKPAALIAIAHLLLILRDLEGTYQQLVNVVMLFQMICLFVLTLKLPPTWKIEAHEWVRWVVLSFSLGKIVMTWVLAFSDEHPGQSVVRVCERWLDIITNTGISLPALAMADFTTGAWLVFLGLHISASAPFYVKWLNYSVAWAVFKVIVIQSFGLLVYAKMERSKCLAYIKYREQALQKKLANPEDVPLHVGAKASHNAATLKQDVSAIPSTKQSVDMESSSVLELDQPAPELHIASQPVYASRFKKKKIMLKIHCDIEPHQLLTGPNSNLLHSLLDSSLASNLIVESALRHGCIVVSVDLCEPLRIDDELSPFSSTASEHEVARKVAGSILKWLHASDAQRLKDGTLLTIQVNNLLFKGCWDASSHSVQLLEDMHALPTKDQYSIALSEPAILLPAFLPEQQHPARPQNYSVSFSVSVSAPTGAELVGWQNSRGASTVEGGWRGEEGVLQLLAHTRGMFLPVEVTEVSRADEGQRTVQVCVSLLPSMLMHGQCFRLELELVESSTLLCSRSILLMGSQLNEALQELKGWSPCNANTPGLVGVFLEDLAEFLSFQGLAAPSTITTADSSSSSSSGSNSSADLASEKSLLPVLKAEAQTPDMLHMMAEVGMELLQHAVSWGMAALAQQLLTGLMADPLSVPFHAVACGQLPHAHPFAKGGAKEQQQGVQEQQTEFGDAAISEPAQHVQPPVTCSEIVTISDAQLSEDPAQGRDRVCVAGTPFHFSSRSLITCALLSYNKQCLARVLEWGRMYGGPCGYAWLWSAVDASGYSPLQIMQRLPAGHAVLEQLLSDPTARPAALHAQTLVQQVGMSAPAEKATGQAPSPKWHQSGSVEASAGQGDECAGGTAQAASSDLQERGETAVGCCTTSQQPASSPIAPQTHVYPIGVLKVALKALVLGFGDHGDIKEADYRNWSFESAAVYANMWCCLVVLLACYTLVQCLWRGLLLNAVALCLYPILMSLALFAESTRMRKMYMTSGKVTLWILTFIFSVGLLPSMLAQKLALQRLDWAVEVFMYRLVDQVQLKALLLERAISCVSNTYMYTRLGFSFPLGRALALSLCSLLIGLALDVRNRCIFLKINALSATGVHSFQGKVAQVQQASDTKVQGLCNN